MSAQGEFMNRSTLARRYAPLFAIAVVQLLIIAAVPSKGADTSHVAAGTGSGAYGALAPGADASTGAGDVSGAVAGPDAGGVGASGGPVAAGGAAAGRAGGAASSAAGGTAAAGQA